MADKNLVQALINHTQTSEQLRYLATEYNLMDNSAIQEKFFERRWRELEQHMPLGDSPLSPSTFLSATESVNMDTVIENPTPDTVPISEINMSG